jgi:uncharacterized protein YcgI (DUF1989 family)
MATDGLRTTRKIIQERLHGGQMWSRVLRRGQVLRLTDLEGGASVAALFFNADDPLERYNMPDTLKAQHIARLTRGFVLFSDMGRVLCSIVEDTCGWHDTITGHADAALTRAKYGEGSYQKLRNDFYRNTRDNFLVELGKSAAGTTVALRAELNTLVVLSNTPHPLDPATTYGPKPVGLAVEAGTPAGPHDECRETRPENGRGFALTEDYFK